MWPGLGLSQRQRIREYLHVERLKELKGFTANVEGTDFSVVRYRMLNKKPSYLICSHTDRIEGNLRTVKIYKEIRSRIHSYRARRNL